MRLVVLSVKARTPLSQERYSQTSIDLAFLLRRVCHDPSSGTFAGSQSPAHPLIESNRIEGTRVYDREGRHIGTIDHLVIEKVSGRLVYAVMSFGGFLGIGAHRDTVPWEKLHYDISLGAFHTDITEAELQDAPRLPHDADQKREEEFRRYWDVPRYWI